jgi:hypothetical protein
LSVVELHDRNTAQYLKENVEMTLSRYGIEPPQVLTITTDNGANMLSMVNELNDSVNLVTPNNDPGDENDDAEVDDTIEFEVEGAEGIRKITGIRCAAHCLQLGVKAACQEIQDFIERCRQIIRKLRTPNMSLKLKDEHLPQAYLDTPIRWDSTADMLENLKTLEAFCVAHMTVEADLWAELATYLEIFLPCRVLSKRLQTEQLTCGDFYIAWMRCRHQLSQLDHPFARILEACIVDRQAVLFSNDHFLAAIYLDPRINSVLDNNQATTARNVLVDVYMRISKLKQHQPSGPSTSSSSIGETANHQTQNQNFEQYLRHQFVGNDRTIIQSSLNNELIYKLVVFLQQPVLPPESNILEYWAKKQMTDPYLFTLARVVLATPPTSVSVERLFSSLKFVLNNLRMRLNDAIIEDIMVIRNNHLYSKKL